MSTGNVLLQGRHICKSYQQGKKSNSVLHDVNIEIYDCDFTVIMGSSGAGKLHKSSRRWFIFLIYGNHPMICYFTETAVYYRKRHNKARRKELLK